jgi:hypothetical protein
MGLRIPKRVSRAIVARFVAAITIGAIAVVVFVSSDARESTRAFSSRAEFAPIDRSSPFWRHLEKDRLELARRLEDPLGYEFLSARSIVLEGGGKALMLGDRNSSGRGPILYVFDRRENLLWKTYEPIRDAGDLYARVALSAGPKGSLLVVWSSSDGFSEWNDTRARQFDAEGDIVLEFRVGEHSNPLLTSVLYWPGGGWAIAGRYVADGGDRSSWSEVQLFGFDGEPLWSEPIRLDTGVGDFRASFIPMILDAPDSLTLIWTQWGQGARGRSIPNLFVTQRFSSRGEPRWSRPVTVGAGPYVPESGTLIDMAVFWNSPSRLRRLGDGVVQATLLGYRFGDQFHESYSAVIDADGRVRIDPIPKQSPGADRKPIG